MKHSFAKVFWIRNGERSGPVKNGDRTVCVKTRSLRIGASARAQAVDTPGEVSGNVVALILKLSPRRFCRARLRDLRFVPGQHPADHISRSVIAGPVSQRRHPVRAIPRRDLSIRIQAPPGAPRRRPRRGSPTSSRPLAKTADVPAFPPPETAPPRQTKPHRRHSVHSIPIRAYRSHGRYRSACSEVSRRCCASGRPIGSRTRWSPFPALTSATAHDEPTEPCIWYGYVYRACRTLPAAASWRSTSPESTLNVSCEGCFCICSKKPSCAGSAGPGFQSNRELTRSQSPPRVASPQPRRRNPCARLPSRRGYAAPSSGRRKPASLPFPAACTTRPWSMPGTRTACTNSNCPVIRAILSSEGTGFPRTVHCCAARRFASSVNRQIEPLSADQFRVGDLASARRLRSLRPLSAGSRPAHPAGPRSQTQQRLPCRGRGQSQICGIEVGRRRLTTRCRSLVRSHGRIALDQLHAGDPARPVLPRPVESAR